MVEAIQTLAAFTFGILAPCGLILFGICKIVQLADEARKNDDV